MNLLMLGVLGSYVLRVRYQQHLTCNAGISNKTTIRGYPGTYLHKIAESIGTSISHTREEFMGKSYKAMNWNFSIERCLDRGRVTFPHFTIGEDNVRSAQECEVQVVLVVLFRESIHILAHQFDELLKGPCYFVPKSKSSKLVD